MGLKLKVEKTSNKIFGHLPYAKYFTFILSYYLHNHYSKEVLLHPFISDKLCFRDFEKAVLLRQSPSRICN